MTTPVRINADTRCYEITKVAVDIVKKRGIKAVTIRNVAEEYGELSMEGVRHHYKNNRAIRQAVANELSKFSEFDNDVIDWRKAGLID